MSGPVVATLATRPQQGGGKAYRHRKLEAIRKLPVNCTRDEAYDFVVRWNPRMGQKAREVLITNIVRTYRHPRVEVQWNKIAARVETERLANPVLRYEEAFRLVAVQVRNGRNL